MKAFFTGLPYVVGFILFSCGIGWLVVHFEVALKVFVIAMFTFAFFMLCYIVGMIVRGE